MIKSYKIRLHPTNLQEEMLWKHVNAFRYVWNFGLVTQMQRFENGLKHLSKFDLRKELNNHKETELWLKECGSHNLEAAVFDLQDTYNNFFEIQKKGIKYSKSKIKKAVRNNKPLTFYDMLGHPKFKKKEKSESKFYVDTEHLYFKDGKVNLLKIGKVKFQTNYKLPLGKGYKYSNPRIKYENEKWILSFGMECENQAQEHNDYTIGIDLGVKDLAVVAYDSEKLVIKNINKTSKVKKLKKRLRQAQRKVSKKYKTNGNFAKSKNIKKAEKRVKKLHQKLSNIRKNHIHQSTNKIMKLNPKRIVMEDLNIVGMMKNKYLSEAISEQCMNEFRRQIRYKSEWNGIDYKEADRYYPSSKTCSECGTIKAKLKLKERIYQCEHCGIKIDRDYNAARNLSRLV